MAERNLGQEPREKQVQLQSILSLAGMAINLLHSISQFLLMIKSSLLAKHLTQRKSFWQERVYEKSRRRANRQRRSTWYVKGRTDKWWDKMISGRLPEDNWKKNFRMPRQQFEKLANELNHALHQTLPLPITGQFHQ